MKIRGHGNGVAIALAALAVVIAGTGTAFAVTATTVHIEDGYTAGRFAHVDTAGHLSTTGATSPIDSTGLAYSEAGDNFITSPTTATLAVSTLSFSNPSYNSTASYAEVRFYFYKVGVDSNGNCSSAAAAVVYLGIYNIAPGDDVEDSFPAPLIVKPVNGAKYCLDLEAQTLGGGTYSAAYFPAYSLTAYVTAGSYTGIGVSAVHSTPSAIAKREKTATSR